MSSEVYESHKANGDYDDGVAVICGKLWRGRYAGWSVNGIDSDNDIATRELCTRNGRALTVQEFGDRITFTELHDDKPYRIHIYVISKTPFKEKPIGRINREKQPAIEVKANGRSTMYCSPSRHGWLLDDKDRNSKPFLPYHFVKLTMPWIDENCEFERHINHICQNYAVPYLNRKTNASKKILLPSKICVGARHNTLLTRINATIHDLIDQKPKEQIRSKCYGLNNLCLSISI